MSRFIELFAGCGGMSLGLQSRGFELALANELSPMAAETFAFNHLDIDLSKETSADTGRVLWISSKYPRSELAKRLRENLTEAPEMGSDEFSDLDEHGLTGSGDLVIGSVVDLNKYIESQLEVNNELETRLSVDLVSGGPPCQSFSMAGLRQLDNHRNRLPWEFAKFVSLVKPKVALLENVSGILRAFKQDGQEYHAWKEVAKAFSSIGYAPICIHANAKYVGVAQNRPRFLMFALEQETLQKIPRAGLNDAERAAIDMAANTLKVGFDWSTFQYWDVSEGEDAQLFEGYLFAPLLTHRTKDEWVSAKNALGDLESPNRGKLEISGYVRQLNETFATHSKSNILKNTDKRKHSHKVQQRFRVYQVLERVKIRSLFKAIIAEKDEATMATLTAPLMRQKFLFEESETLRAPVDQDELVELFRSLETRKHSQRALVSSNPAPAALSIPDDCCHYSSRELRTLSVREVARLQSFPDTFEFRSKVTTGGVNRKFEVPQYTQAGNAVPPLLARSAGEVVNRLLGF